MKQHLIILVKAGVAIVLLSLTLLFASVLYLNYWPLEGGRHRIQRAGGVEKINWDANIVFTRLRATNSIKYQTLMLDGTDHLKDDGLPDLPSLRTLAGRQYMDIQEGQGQPEYIFINYGDHFQMRYIFIFDPTQPVNTNWLQHLSVKMFQVHSNIFVSKK